MSKKWKRNAAKVRGIYHVWVNIAHWADPHDDETAHSWWASKVLSFWWKLYIEYYYRACRIKLNYIRFHARNGNYAPKIWQQEAEIFELRLAVEDKIRQKNLPGLTEVKYE